MYINIQEIISQQPFDQRNDTLVVGSDGAHSKIRKSIKKREFKSYENMGYALVVSYNVSNEKVKSLKLAEHVYPLVKAGGYILYEMTKPKTVNGVFLIQEDEYNVFFQNTYKNKIVLSDENMKNIPNLLNSIKLWFCIRISTEFIRGWEIWWFNQWCRFCTCW